MSQPLNIIWMIFWAVGLCFGCLGAMTVAPVYIGLHIFVSCVPEIKRLIQPVHKLVLLPHFAADNFMHARSPIEGFRYIYEGTPP